MYEFSCIRIAGSIYHLHPLVCFIILIPECAFEFKLISVFLLYGSLTLGISYTTSSLFSRTPWNTKKLPWIEGQINPVQEQ